MDLNDPVVIVGIFLVYWAPWIIAILRGHQSDWAIAVLNTTLGWTVIGWLLALIWSLAEVRRPVRWR